MKVVKGDTVKILYGNDAGSTGKVLAVDNKKGTVIVEGKNMHTKHVKGDGQSRRSQIVTIMKPMPISKVMVVDPMTGKPTRVGYDTVSGKKVRVSKKSGKSIDQKGTGTKAKSTDKPESVKEDDKKKEEKSEKKKSTSDSKKKDTKKK